MIPEGHVLQHVNRPAPRWLNIESKCIKWFILQFKAQLAAGHHIIKSSGNSEIELTGEFFSPVRINAGRQIELTGHFHCRSSSQKVVISSGAGQLPAEKGPPLILVVCCPRLGDGCCIGISAEVHQVYQVGPEAHASEYTERLIDAIVDYSHSHIHVSHLHVAYIIDLKAW